jgi:hypothetical protein
MEVVERHQDHHDAEHHDARHVTIASIFGSRGGA